LATLTDVPMNKANAAELVLRARAPDSASLKSICMLRWIASLALCCNLCNIRLDIDPQKHGVLNL
jgi:tRNA threonylcarbamoyladenosine modification (KEOPS) complex  Pcc1 subunit